MIWLVNFVFERNYCKFRNYYVHELLQFLKNAQKCEINYWDVRKICIHIWIRYQNASSYYCYTLSVTLLALIKTISEFTVHLMLFLLTCYIKKCNYFYDKLVFMLRTVPLKHKSSPWQANNNLYDRWLYQNFTVNNNTIHIYWSFCMKYLPLDDKHQRSIGHIYWLTRVWK